jgi:hypothetical protein
VEGASSNQIAAGPVRRQFHPRRADQRRQVRLMLELLHFFAGDADHLDSGKDFSQNIFNIFPADSLYDIRAI